jgi:hypothetical protein
VMLRLVLCTFDMFLVLFPTCPPANGQTPKLVKSVSFKALFLGLVFVYYNFMVELVVRNVS